VVTADWPVADEPWADPAAEVTVAEVQRLVTEVRRFRNDQGLKPGQRVAARLTGLTGEVAGLETEVRSLARLDAAGADFEATARLVLGGQVAVELDLSGAIDVAAERRRLEKDLAVARKDLDQAVRKLGNEQFLTKAPEPVVAKIRDRKVSAEADIARIEDQLARLPVA
jgi:valyl-tRNA synthetase